MWKTVLSGSKILSTPQMTQNISQAPKNGKRQQKGLRKVFQVLSQSANKNCRKSENTFMNRRKVLPNRFSMTSKKTPARSP